MQKIVRDVKKVFKYDEIRKMHDFDNVRAKNSCWCLLEQVRGLYVNYVQRVSLKNRKIFILCQI
jgi:hypothetical protein